MTIQAGSSTEAAIQAPEKQASATPEDARKFIENAETKLLDIWIRASRAQWVHQTFITHDTEILSAQADQVVKATVADLAAQSNQYEHLKLPEDVARKIYLLKHSVDIPAPRDPAEQAELSQIVASLESDYGQGKWCPDGAQGKCLTLNDMENIMASSRDPKELERVWVGWHSIAPPMRQKYSRMVVLANKGARELGFANVGEMWRSGYDMPPDA
ncbi:MAG TPA: M2 family metallopeptidase, partial [Rhizomicrobium sp.]